MAINHIQNAIAAAISTGNACINAVRGWQASKLRHLESHGVFMSRGFWHALGLKRMPATATPATCWTKSDRRHQRPQRWMSGVVVVDPGTVGVS
jgi:hypothetical protein